VCSTAIAQTHRHADGTIHNENHEEVAADSTDTVSENAVDLQETTVVGRQSGTVMSNISLLKTETITTTGLQKLACCNLSETFENSASATISFTDAVSGAKQIQLLGLSGIYSQTMAENIPTMRGLASTYGLSYTPAPWLESIQISKGAASVVNGYESVTGNMNLEFKKPNNTEPLFINLYGDLDQRYEANVTGATKVAKNLWTGLMLSGMYNEKPHDNNGDTFLDMPKTKYINAYNRWLYENEDKGIESRTGIKFLYEDRIAGQDEEHHKKQNITDELYKTFIDNKGLTVENKTGFVVGERPGQSIGIINSFTHYEQNSAFGYKTFNGKQDSYYLNALFSSYFSNTDHRYTTGLSLMYDNFDTEFKDEIPFNQTPLTPINREEVVPGAFFEYTETSINKLTAVVGIRADYNSRFGWLITPRLSAKYDLNEYVIFRASAGRGYRSPNVLAENIGLMASSRNFDLSNINDLDIEKAWNFGGNIAFNIPIWSGRKAKLSLDYYHTSFDNRIVIDTERNRNAVFFYNSDGSKNYANAWQADLSATLFDGFDLFAAFRYNNNRVTYADGTETDQPLISNYRGLVNLSYATNLRRWVFDVTAQFNGKTRLPAQNGYGSEKQYSPAFPVMFAQVTRNSKRFDVYAGAENFLNYKQKEPILNWEQPFSQDFDASQVWGPITGIRIYAGIRLRIGKLN
jgi:hypothetical protein